MRQADQLWRETPLDVSFRSTRPVLELVDRVFADPTAAAGVVEPGQTLQHLADRADHAGSVELWPLAPRAGRRRSAALVGGRRQPRPADRRRSCWPRRWPSWIQQQTSGGVLLESKGRPLAPGDVMVLVRRRNDFARALVRALKARDVPVAGLDRLVLTEQPAVQDLMALADALLLPQDDLSFACLLTSPLGGLNDDDLMALSDRRRAPLWDTLRARAAERPHWQRAWDFFATLLARVDYVSPYMLFAEALGPLGGRARLYARLGPEAAEPVDELLNAALAYSRSHPPSLQGFLHWLRRSGAEVKREAEAAGNLVRVMTVHGAKGLQAPLVILPDTTALPPDDGALLWADDPQTGVAVPLWAPRKELRCAAADRIRADGAQRRMEEHNRLLYVALTRAEDRLLVCGWQTSPAAAGHLLVQPGQPRLCRAGRRGRGVRRAGASCAATPPRRSPRPTSRSGSPRRPDQQTPPPAWLGGAPDWLPVPPPDGTRPATAAGAQPAGGGGAWADPGGRLAAGRAGGAGRPVPSRPAAACVAAAPARRCRRSSGRRRRGGGWTGRATAFPPTLSRRSWPRPWRSWIIRTWRLCSGQAAGRRCR